MTGDSTPARLIVEIDGVAYARWVTTSRPDGRSDADDELILEVRTGDLNTVLLFVSRFGDSGEMRLTAMSPDLPLTVVEWALAEAKVQLG